MSDSPLHPACWSDDRLLQNCQIRFVRRSGPGGQHRNKVESGVQLVYRPAGITAEANERRSQAENRHVALRRLRLQLAVGVRTQFDVVQPLTDVWCERVQRGRIVISPQHNDFPLLLAIALDCIAAQRWDVRAAATLLGCSATQLVRFLGDFTPALAELNVTQRKELGLKPLRWNTMAVTTRQSHLQIAASALLLIADSRKLVRTLASATAAAKNASTRPV
jgi:hypothetical protein